MCIRDRHYIHTGHTTQDIFPRDNAGRFEFEYTLNIEDYPYEPVSYTHLFPIRVAAEALGATVDWDANTYTVLINTKGVSVEKPEWNIIRRDVGRTFELKSLEPNRYFRFVCTSHPELNYKNTYDWNGNPIVERMDDGYCVSYELAPGGRYYDIPLKKGMVVTFDVYEKINGVEVKVDTIVETL